MNENFKLYDKEFTIDDVSPEIAAEIVRDYLIPMFDTKEKRKLRTKYSKLRKGKE